MVRIHQFLPSIFAIDELQDARIEKGDKANRLEEGRIKDDCYHIISVR